MRSRSLLVVTTAALLSCGAAAAGCSSDDRPLTTGDVLPPGGGSNADSGAPSGEGGGASPCDPDDAIAAEGEVVAELVVRAAAPPAPLGGQLDSGTYVLTELVRFEPAESTRNDADGGGSGGPTSSVVAIKTLVIEGDRYRLSERIGDSEGGALPAPTLSGGTFVIERSSVVLTETCPGSSPRTIGFSSVGSSISLYPVDDRRETYQKM